MAQVKEGDYLLFYMASKGFIALASITGPMKKPTDREETPWAGGLYRYGVVIPFKLDIELAEPMRKSFEQMKVSGTSITATALRRGFAPVSNADGGFLTEEMTKLPRK